MQNCMIKFIILSCFCQKLFYSIKFIQKFFERSSQIIDDLLDLLMVEGYRSHPIKK